jgi:3-methyladenine DNA glycosylase/8-oxoguanine DNA glycosylase
MATLTLQPPADYVLARDVCSYGYFLLAPNYWDTRSRTLWRVLALSGGAVLVHISQEGRAGAALKVALSRRLGGGERGEATHQVTRMLRLDEGRDAVREFHRLDPRFAKSRRGRLLRSPTLFEDVIKTVTSCNVTWPNTVNMNRRLCDVVGARVQVEDVRKMSATRGQNAPAPRIATDVLALLPLRAFPTAARLAKERPSRLRELCRVGYRDARIVELARLFSTPVSRGGVDQAALENPATPDERVHNTLIELPGIGPYAAANIMQLLGRYTRLPLDTESVRHGRSVLGMRGASAAVMKRMAAHYRPFGAHAFRSYWFELWDFYEAKHGKAWTWERDTTGRMFTAALLNK